MALTPETAHRLDALRLAGCEVAGPTRMYPGGEPPVHEPDYSGESDHTPYWICVIVPPAGLGPDIEGRGEDDEGAATAAVVQAEARLATG